VGNARLPGGGGGGSPRKNEKSSKKEYQREHALVWKAWGGCISYLQRNSILERGGKNLKPKEDELVLQRKEGEEFLGWLDEIDER